MIGCGEWMLLYQYIEGEQYTVSSVQPIIGRDYDHTDYDVIERLHYTNISSLVSISRIMRHVPATYLQLYLKKVLPFYMKSTSEVGSSFEAAVFSLDFKALAFKAVIDIVFAYKE